jgi:Zn-dependent protease with chaperone function
VHETFEAQAFHPDLGNEVVNGEMFFAGWVLRFRSGAVAVEIPLDRLVADVTDGDGRLFFTDPEQPELKIMTADPALLKCHTLPQVERIRGQLTARLTRRELLRRLKLVLYFVGTCVLIVWTGIAAMGAMVRAVAARVPPEWEAEVGDNLIAELKTEMTFVENSNDVAALTTLAEPLLRALPAGPTKYTFHVVRDDEPNAHALPGGHILVNTGLLELADRPEELLGVIAHEAAHVTLKHHFRKGIAAGGPYLVFQMFVGGRGGTLGALAGVSALMIGQGFSQDYEMEADDAGWEYLVKANIDPRGMAAVFRKLKAYESMQKALKIPQAFSSHPALEKRLRRLENKWKKLPRKSGFLVFGNTTQRPP